NDLGELLFGRAYWLYATQAVTPYLGVPGATAPLVAAPASPVALQLPPTTFYGWLLPWGDFDPQAGDSVQAWIGEQLCGQDIVTLVEDQLAYKLQVSDDSALEGCGKPGRLVHFYVNGQLLPLSSAAWDNRQAWFHLLGPPNNPVYLPLVVRSGADPD
ncbi:MAG: hypothetical protein JXA78_06530, partial [Anaerolineales bacterium]|nr:hypothetical protein [Anaerolineales bacterium]